MNFELLPAFVFEFVAVGLLAGDIYHAIAVPLLTKARYLGLDNSKIFSLLLLEAIVELHLQDFSLVLLLVIYVPVAAGNYLASQGQVY